MIRRWLTARRQRRDGVVLAALGGYPYGSFVGDLWRDCGISPGALYVALLRLEQQGRVCSWWTDGPYPRRRIYAVADE